MPTRISLTGKSLHWQSVTQLTTQPTATVGIAPPARAAARRAKALLDRTATTHVTYGVNTGFGPMASHIIGTTELTQLQRNLVRSHATGMGEPLPEAFVIAAMMVRLNTLAKGRSGVSDAVLDQLAAFINQRIVPIIPEHGAVGTSGDLVQLAHIALALTGEGEVFFKGVRMPAAKALKACKLTPVVLGPKEGLSLINGTAVMTGIGALACDGGERVLSTATRAGAWALELIGSFTDSFSERLQEFRPHAGQASIARALRSLTRGSKLLRDRASFQTRIGLKEKVHRIDEDVQEIYSFRCTPQILGPALETWRRTCVDVGIELNSATDNPLIDWEHGTLLHGGNFHGDVIAAAMDFLKAAMVKTTILSERRINFFLNDKVNRRYPPFLNRNTPGLTLALQAIQFVATSTTAQNQSLAFPHHLHSISTNADNQDVVSMGTDAALITSKVIDNALTVQAIELVVLAQATDVIGCRAQLSPAAQQWYKHVRAIIPPLTDDRSMSTELNALVAWLRTTPHVSVSWK